MKPRKRKQVATDPRVVDLWVCSACGSADVQMLEWIDANTNHLIGGSESSADADTFCETCDEAGRNAHPGLDVRPFPVVEALSMLSGREGFDRETVVSGAYLPKEAARA